ncbi:MAG: tetratricopeptide repeat-containing sulfotransferase family protein [Arenimonas sp.]
MSASPEMVSNLETALSHASRLLQVNPALAAEQATEILKVLPDQPNALMLLALSQNALGEPKKSLETFSRLIKVQPQWPAAYFEMAQAFAKSGNQVDAIACLLTALRLKPDLPKAWLCLGDYYSASEDEAKAQLAYANHVRYSASDPELLNAAAALADNNIPEAEHCLKSYLKHYPTDVAAIRMLAEVAARLGRDIDTENLLARCIELAPNFHFARQNYGLILNRLNKGEQALAQAEILLQADPENLSYLNIKAVALNKLGDCDTAIKLYDSIISKYPGYSKIWHSYGHTLKTAGFQDRAVHAYRKSIELEPTYGEAYWSLANLKTFRFSQDDIVQMQSRLESGRLSDGDRFHFDFALGKALEDLRDYAKSFMHYEKGNSLRKTLIHYSPERNRMKVEECETQFTSEFFREREDFGIASAEPIFILGMPRAGSTLLEQMLSSHSQVEGTMELPDIISITKTLYRQLKGANAKTYYPLLSEMTKEESIGFGERYIQNTRIHRQHGLPFFIDKMPNNFAHIALIQLILPNAKIIDARRHPLACCFSNYKQHFARGQNFSYSLEDMGRYYSDYIRLMSHFDAVLPGRIHRVHYENIVDNTETEITGVLDYCGLPFEAECLRFFENSRPVRTASSEQVRQPIYKEGVDHWRHYEAWLAPMKEALGPVLDFYPKVPFFN